MSTSKERVLAYLQEWEVKGVNPTNMCTIQPYGYGCFNVWFRGKIGCKIYPESDNLDYVLAARILGLTPTAATPKVDDQWKRYSQQMRKELTDTQRELADLKEAYNGLCESHAEAAEKLAEIQESPISLSAIGMHTEEFLAEQDYNGWAGDGPIKSIVRSAIKAIILRYSIAKKKHGKVPE